MTPLDAHAHAGAEEEQRQPDVQRSARPTERKSHWVGQHTSTYMSAWHRRSIELEDKTKVVASDCRTESLQLFCLGLFETNG